MDGPLEPVQGNIDKIRGKLNQQVLDLFLSHQSGLGLLALHIGLHLCRFHRRFSLYVKNDLQKDISKCRVLQKKRIVYFLYFKGRISYKQNMITFFD
jgi:hypothetical protein